MTAGSPDQVAHVNNAIAAGLAAYRRGDLDVARSQLESLDHPQALHILGLVERRAGNLDAARDALSRAAAANPLDHEIPHNQGLLARQLNRDDIAEAAYRRALSLKPDFRQARIALARLLVDHARWPEAGSIYSALRRQDSTNVPARFGMATVRLEQGHPRESLALLEELISEGHDEAAIRFMRGRARLELCEMDAALDDFAAAHAAEPTPLTLKTLASAVWMRGEREAFDNLIAASLPYAELVVTAAELVRQAGQPDQALQILEAAEQNGQLFPDALAARAYAAIDAEKPELAEAAAMNCLAAQPGNPNAIDSLIIALLMQGKPKKAMTRIASMRAAEPDRQHWIAYEVTALRMMGDERYSTLIDFDHHVRAYELPVPDGFASIEEFNSAFLAALDRLQPFTSRPLDQSLRGGTQTPIDLTAVEDPVVEAYIRALDQPIRAYMEAIGNAPGHPLTRRNTGKYRIAGCWSVRLAGGGRHVNHVHPDGWISSAYYAAVPESGEGKAGWIKFGEPSFPTEPACSPEKWISPKAGMLVLFPSYLWHGTEPIVDDAVRVTAPFDAVPV